MIKMSGQLERLGKGWPIAIHHVIASHKSFNPRAQKKQNKKMK
jgi:hypothetical protein